MASGQSSIERESGAPLAQGGRAALGLRVALWRGEGHAHALYKERPVDGGCAARLGRGSSFALDRRPPLSAVELVNRFYRLPTSRKAELIDRFALLEAPDWALPEQDRYRRALRRAGEKGQLTALAEAILATERR